jgi:hypothetical protein
MLFLMKNIKLHQNISTLVAFFVQALEKANDVPLDLTSISRDFDRVSHPVQLILRLTQTAFPHFQFFFILLDIIFSRISIICCTS